MYIVDALIALVCVLEDIVEEVFGDIQDEHEPREAQKAATVDIDADAPHPAHLAGWAERRSDVDRHQADG